MAPTRMARWAGSTRSTCSWTSRRCTGCRATRSCRRATSPRALPSPWRARPSWGCWRSSGCGNGAWTTWAGRERGDRTNVRHLLQRCATLDVVHHPVLLRGRNRRGRLLPRGRGGLVRRAGGSARRPHRVQRRRLGRDPLWRAPDDRSGTAAAVLAHAVPVGERPGAHVQGMVAHLLRGLGASLVRTLRGPLGPRGHGRGGAVAQSGAPHRRRRRAGGAREGGRGRGRVARVLHWRVHGNTPLGVVPA